MPDYSIILSRVPSTLDYEECTTAELCKFFEERSKTPLDKAQLRNIRNHGNSLLVDRLRDMDRERSFPRFLELPPELRLGVYEALLVESEVVEHATISTLQPAILRTSKHVYAEALPVLYKRNTFGTVIEYSELESGLPRVPVSIVGCSLTITRPGSEPAFYQRTPRGLGRGSLLRRLLRDRTMSMLRESTHFTIDLNLVTPGKQELSDYVSYAYDAMATLCLAFVGRSKLEELTIKVIVGDPRVTDTSLAFILWPLLFLRTEVVVKIEGASAVAVVEVKELAGLLTGPAEERHFGRQIADVRRLCSAEIEKRGWKNRCKSSDWLDGLRKVERALNRVDYCYICLICLDDILNLSALWERVRGEADRVEAE